MFTRNGSQSHALAAEFGFKDQNLSWPPGIQLTLGKNTPKRQEFIIKNLKIELNIENNL